MRSVKIMNAVNITYVHGSYSKGSILPAVKSPIPENMTNYKLYQMSRMKVTSSFDAYKLSLNSGNPIIPTFR